MSDVKAKKYVGTVNLEGERKVDFCVQVYGKEHKIIHIRVNTEILIPDFTFGNYTSVTILGVPTKVKPFHSSEGLTLEFAQGFPISSVELAEYQA